MQKIRDVFVKVLSDISAITMEIVPMLIGAGFVSGLCALWKNLGGDTGNSVYQLLNMLGAVGTYGLPFYMAYAASKRFNCHTGISLLLAVFITYPSVASYINGEEAVRFLGIPVAQQTYTGTFFPMIITCYVQSLAEKYIFRKFPQSLSSSITPALEAILMSIVAILITAPLGNIIGVAIANCVLWIHSLIGPVGIIIACTLWPLLISTGAHMAFVPYMQMTLAELGVEKIVFPASIGANYSQMGVCLAVALKAKTKKLKAEATAAGISAFNIITEPALYGIDFKLKRPLIAALCGCFASGVWIALNNVYAYNMAGVSLWGLATWSSEANPRNLMNAIIAMIISVVVAFVVTWILGFDETEFATEEELASGNINTAGKKA